MSIINSFFFCCSPKTITITWSYYPGSLAPMEGLQTTTETLVRTVGCGYYRETPIDCGYYYGYGQAYEFIDLRFDGAQWVGEGGETCSAGIVQAYKQGATSQDPCDPRGTYDVFYGNNNAGITWTVT